MPPVFGHGRLRLYLLKLLHESPRHGYEVIRLLEERFQGLYSPSAGTVYPRLAKLTAEGLVTHTEGGGRKVYSLTEEGERELADREGELASLEREIRESLAVLASEIQDDVSGAAHSLREELDRIAAEAPGAGAGSGWSAGGKRPKGDRGSREQRWEESAAAQEKAARAAADHFQETARRVRERVERRAETAGDWQSALRDGMDSLGKEISGFSRLVSTPRPAAGTKPDVAQEGAGAGDEQPVDDPRRELERLLDTFRDEVRDAARDGGVNQEQLRTARRQLSAATAHLVALLRSPDAYRKGTGER